MNKAIPFSENVSAGRFLLTSAILLLCDTAAMWGLTAIGLNIYAAKLISCVLIICVSILVRMMFMRVKYKK